MAADTVPSRRQRTLARLVDLVRHEGLPPDASLRWFAARLDTSHRMLAYYFGSREGLLTEVLAVLGDEDRRSMLSTAAEWGRRDALLAMWSFYTDPAAAMRQEAALSVQALALRNPEQHRQFLAGPAKWVDLIRRLGLEEGLDHDLADAQAQLLVSAVRGLLIDRLASEHPERIDAAFALLVERLLPGDANAGSGKLGADPGTHR